MLFHAEVFMPEVARRPVYEGPLHYRQHAQDEARKDRYGRIALPCEFRAAGARLVEAEVVAETERVVKQVWRQPLDELRDLVLVLNPDGFVRTVWVNLRADTHRSLDKTKYVGGYEWRCRHRARSR